MAPSHGLSTFNKPQMEDTSSQAILSLQPRATSVRRETKLSRADTMATRLRGPEQPVLRSLRGPADSGRRICDRRRDILQSDTRLQTRLDRYAAMAACLRHRNGQLR